MEKTGLSDQISRAGQTALRVFDYASKPLVFLQLRRLLFAALGFWILSSLWLASWSFYPSGKPLEVAQVINPPQARSGPQDADSVDIDALVAAHLFGEPGELIDDAQLVDADASGGRSPAMSEEEAAEALAGIEKGAPETRLPLLLRGVVSSSNAGLGQAVIEYQKRQDLYRVGDELPVNDEVELAKVLADRVVLSNKGRYEILNLFEDSDLVAQTASLPMPAPERKPVRAPITQTEAAQARAAGLASNYRDRLYSDPQSLAEVVRVTAVRDGGALRGYRVSPGNAAAEFTALGFEPGDLVTAVNGMPLSEPSNTVRLYQEMRSATEAVFDVERGGQQLTLNVSLGGSQ